MCIVCERAAEQSGRQMALESAAYEIASRITLAERVLARATRQADKRSHEALLTGLRTALKLVQEQMPDAA